MSIFKSKRDTVKNEDLEGQTECIGRRLIETNSREKWKICYRH